jgi:WbqC-like protein
VAVKLAIHQSEYWPIPRLLAKWRAADLLILLDIVQFNRESLQHRCKVRANDGMVRTLTIPFRHEVPFPQIRALEAAEADWMEKHQTRLHQWYRGRAALERLGVVDEWFTEAAAHRHEGVAFHSARTMLTAAAWARVTVPVIWASTLLPPPGGWGPKNELIVNLCQAVRAKTYLSGRSGALYLDSGLFERHGIGIEIQAFQPAERDELSSLHVYLAEGPDALAAQVKR